MPPLEQLKPVSAGVFDLLFCRDAYHPGSNGPLKGVDALMPDPALFDHIDENYRKRHGLRLLARKASGTTDHHLMLMNLPNHGVPVFALRNNGAVAVPGRCSSCIP